MIDLTHKKTQGPHPVSGGSYCVLCSANFPPEKLYKIHYIGGGPCTMEERAATQHHYVCPFCSIPELWEGCDCGELHFD